MSLHLFHVLFAAFERERKRINRPHTLTLDINALRASHHRTWRLVLVSVCLIVYFSKYVLGVMELTTMTYHRVREHRHADEKKKNNKITANKQIAGKRISYNDCCCPVTLSHRVHSSGSMFSAYVYLRKCLLIIFFFVRFYYYLETDKCQRTLQFFVVVILGFVVALYF